MTMTREGRRGNGVGPMPSTDCLSMQTLDGQAAKAGELRTVWASAERGQQTVWEAFGARAMKDADLEEQRACWDNRRTSQAGNAARTQQEYDDDESGATALMEGVGATAGGRFYRLHRGRNRAGTAMRGSLPVEGSTLGGGSKTVVPFHFWARIQRPGATGREKSARKVAARANLPSVGRIGWIYVVAPVTMPHQAAGHPPSCS